MSAIELPDTLIQIDAALEQVADADVDLPQRLQCLGEAASLADCYFVQAAQTPDANSVAEDGGRPAHPNDFGQVTASLNRASRLLNEALLPALAEEGIHLEKFDDLGQRQQEWLGATFREQMFPLLIPLAVDPGRPFPRLRDRGLNLLVVLQDLSDEAAFGNPVHALVEVPDAVSRWLKVDAAKSTEDSQIPWFSAASIQSGTYIWTENLVQSQIKLLFPGMSIEHSNLFRVIYTASPNRTANPSLPDYRSLHHVARLDVEEAMPLPMRRWLSHHLNIPAHTLVRNLPPMAMADLVEIAKRLPVRKRGFFHRVQRYWQTFFRSIDPVS